jgi:FkbM family methyltransferase
MRKLKQWIWYLLTKRMHLNWMLPTNIEVCVRSYGDWWLFNEMFVDKIYDEDLEAILLSNTSKPLYVLDLGANVGYFSVRCLHLYRHLKLKNPLNLFLVEGSSSVFKDLQKRLKTISLNTENIQLYQALVGELAGKDFLANGREGSCNRISKKAKHVGEWSEYLDLNTIHAHEDKKWDLIKCDIEGSEYLFIHNYPDLLRNTRYLICEFHSFDTSTSIESALQILASYGFVPISKKGNKDFPVISFKNNMLNAFD